mgnify:CR=1 FL=1
MGKVCPWYRQGFCISSLLDKPTDTVTSAKRCLTNEYRTCKFYKNTIDEQKTEGLENFTEEPKNTSTNDLHITELMVSEVYANCNVPESGCEHFIVTRYDGKYYVYCKQKKEWLTKRQTMLCGNVYQKCPWRNE